MLNRFIGVSALGVFMAGLTACAQAPQSVAQQEPTVDDATPSAVSEPTDTPATGRNLTQLFSRVWKLTDAPSEPAPGTIYVFLPNGTLLETSCVETYRIATWTIDKETPDVLRVVEDGQPAFDATIEELTDTTLQLQQTLTLSNEQRELTFSAVEGESVCPDLPR